MMGPQVGWRIAVRDFIAEFFVLIVMLVFAVWSVGTSPRLALFLVGIGVVGQVFIAILNRDLEAS